MSIPDASVLDPDLLHEFAEAASSLLTELNAAGVSCSPRLHANCHPDECPIQAMKQLLGRYDTLKEFTESYDTLKRRGTSR